MFSRKRADDDPEVDDADLDDAMVNFGEDDDDSCDRAPGGGDGGDGEEDSDQDPFGSRADDVNEDVCDENGLSAPRGLLQQWNTDVDQETMRIVCDHPAVKAEILALERLVFASAGALDHPVIRQAFMQLLKYGFAVLVQTKNTWHAAPMRYVTVQWGITHNFETKVRVYNRKVHGREVKNAQVFVRWPPEEGRITSTFSSLATLSKQWNDQLQLWYKYTNQALTHNVTLGLAPTVMRDALRGASGPRVGADGKGGGGGVVAPVIDPFNKPLGSFNSPHPFSSGVGGGGGIHVGNFTMLHPSAPASPNDLVQVFTKQVSSLESAGCSTFQSDQVRWFHMAPGYEARPFPPFPPIQWKIPMDKVDLYARQLVGDRKLAAQDWRRFLMQTFSKLVKHGKAPPNPPPREHKCLKCGFQFCVAKLALPPISPTSLVAATPPWKMPLEMSFLEFGLVKATCPFSPLDPPNLDKLLVATQFHFLGKPGSLQFKTNAFDQISSHMGVVCRPSEHALRVFPQAFSGDKQHWHLLSKGFDAPSWWESGGTVFIDQPGTAFSMAVKNNAVTTGVSVYAGDASPSTSSRLECIVMEPHAGPKDARDVRIVDILAVQHAREPLQIVCAKTSASEYKSSVAVRMVTAFGREFRCVSGRVPVRINAEQATRLGIKDDDRVVVELQLRETPDRPVGLRNKMRTRISMDYKRNKGTVTILFKASSTKNGSHGGSSSKSSSSSSSSSSSKRKRSTPSNRATASKRARTTNELQVPPDVIVRHEQCLSILAKINERQRTFENTRALHERQIREELRKARELLSKTPQPRLPDTKQRLKTNVEYNAETGEFHLRRSLVDA